MAITFQAFDAGAGDALLVSSGDDAVLIDGGESGKFKDVAGPALAARGTRLHQAILTHWDNDHLLGIRDLFFLPSLAGIRPETLRFNEFTQPGPGVQAMSQDDIMRLGILSVDDAVELVHNLPQGVAVIGTKAGDVVDVPTFGLVIIGPTDELLAEAKKEFEDALDSGAFLARAIMSADDSATNRASITCVVTNTNGEPLMLLTGDALGEDVILQLEAAGFVDGGFPFEVPLVKIQHHGSDRNVSQAFLDRIRADHYVFSANGRNANPDEPTVQRLINSIGGSSPTVWFSSDGNTVGQRNHMMAMRALLDNAGIGIGNAPGDPVTIEFP
ncbi:MAG: MBL fold metallo-hydrolase [Acidobacteria bacterium]|nr:MBL fold metallo-hydrolase [Acidobacteriota bacterium]